MTDEDAPAEPDLDTAYLTHFRQHVQQTHLHLQGHDPSSPLSPFYTQNPTSHWTSAEKSAFFHGLSVYSRLRPDLIAEHVKTKNVVDICAYMGMLEDGARSQRVRLKRKGMEVAMEVSEEWVELEEEKAAGLIVAEEKWKATAAGIARENETKKKKREIIPRAKRGEKRSEEEQGRKRAEFNEWHEGQKNRWGKEDLLQSMGVAHLKVIDNILREEEDALSAVTTSRRSTLEPPQLQLPPSTIEDEMIDPVLRTPAEPVAGPSTTVQMPEPNSPKSTLQDLSPASRRRIYKRLYMRRKRSEVMGNVGALPSQTSDIVLRVKPGRKSRPRKMRKTDEGSAIGGDDGDEDDDGDEEDDPRNSHIGGKTRHYKIKSQFEASNLGAQALHENGLGLFHLSALAKLMRMYNLLHDVPTAISSEISADTIQFLYGLVVRFITDLVHRTIVSREQEREMKSHTKVWRFSPEQIASAAVEHALEMVGAEFKNKEGFLAGVFGRLDLLAEEVDSDTAASDRDSGQDEGQDGSVLANDERESAMSTEPLHRGIYNPLVHLPSSHIYKGFRHTTSLDSEDPLFPLDTDEDALAAELEEEDALDVEESTVAQASENVLWGEYGRRRTGTRVTRIKQEAIEADDDAHAHALRFKPPGMDGKVKSQVYISDSD